MVDAQTGCLLPSSLEVFDRVQHRLTTMSLSCELSIGMESNGPMNEGDLITHDASNMEDCMGICDSDMRDVCETMP